jgi:hypothetical protein
MVIAANLIPSSPPRHQPVGTPFQKRTMTMQINTPTPARRFIAAVAAAATALALMTAAAVPARASPESDDFAKALAAIAAIAIIGNSISKNDKGKVESKKRKPDVQYGQRSRRNVVLPHECAVQVRSRRGNSTLYVERCLRRNGVDNRLPQRCATQVNLRNRNVTAYSAECLSNAGFRTERSRRHRH